MSMAVNGAAASQGGLPQGGVALLHFENNLKNEYTGSILSAANISVYDASVFNNGLSCQQTEYDSYVTVGNNIDFDSTWTLEFLLNIYNPKFDNTEYFHLDWLNTNSGADGKKGNINIIVGGSQANGLRVRVYANNDAGSMIFDTGDLYILNVSTTEKVKFKLVCSSGQSITLIVTRSNGDVLYNAGLASFSDTTFTSCTTRRLRILPWSRYYSVATPTFAMTMDEFLIVLGNADYATGFPTSQY